MPVEEVAKIVDEVFRQNFANDPDGDDLQTCLYELTGGQDDTTEALARQLVADEIYLPQDGEEPFYGEDMESTSAAISLMPTGNGYGAGFARASSMISASSISALKIR